LQLQPEGVRPEVAAIASDAGITAYHAVQHTAKVRSAQPNHTYRNNLYWQVKHGEKVLIFGIGGLGHLAVQYAKHFGATGAPFIRFIFSIIY
jgi:propanol-preferring alcohol dehydrogenase